MQKNNQQMAAAIAKAIAYAENGGKPNPNKPVAGKTGEMASIFQFTPGTWKLYAGQILGDEDAELNTDNELKVVMSKVNKWLDEGHDAKEIASMWNAGEQKPDAWKYNKGINKKYGVAYDTPAYAKKVEQYASQFSKDVPDFSSGMSTGMKTSTPVTKKPIDSISKENSKDPLTSILSVMKKASTAVNPAQQVAQKPKNSGLIQQLIQPRA